MNKVVVTGSGIICPLGADKASTFSAALDAQSGIGGCPADIAAWLPHVVVAQVHSDLQTLLERADHGLVEANALQGPINPELGIAMDMSIQLRTETGKICTLSLSFNNDGPLGTFFRYICDNGTYIARYDDLVDGKEEPIDVTQVDVSTRVTKTVGLNVPVMSSAMDTVTEAATAICMARDGGIGIVHKNYTIPQQALEVLKVKKAESGVVVNPVTNKIYIANEFSYRFDKVVLE